MLNACKNMYTDRIVKPYMFVRICGFFIPYTRNNKNNNNRRIQNLW